MKAIYSTLLSATMMCVVGGCAVDIEDGEAPDTREDVEERTETSTDALITAPGQAWAWIQSNGTRGFAYNSLGGTTTSSRLATGQYHVRFGSIPGSGGNAQVVAYGEDDAHCKLFTDPLGSSRTDLYVLCYDSAGSLTDSAFNITFDHRAGTGSASGPNSGGYLTTSGTGGGVHHSWNSLGNANAVFFNSAATQYDVAFHGLTLSNAAVHVTAVGPNSVKCKPKYWGYGGVTVVCLDSAGNPATSRFSVTMQGGTVFGGTKPGGHAWVTSGSPYSTYTSTKEYGSCASPAVYSGAADGLDVEMTLTNIVAPPSPPVGWTNFIPMVNGYGDSDTHCKIVNWTLLGGAAEYRVRCWRGDGTQVSASSFPFSTSVTSQNLYIDC